MTPGARSLTPASLRELATGFQASRVLLTAVELRVFSAIGSERRTSAEIAARLATDPRATDRLLNALCALGLLSKADARFANTPDGARLLVESSPEFVANLGHTAHMWRSWHELTACVREGRPAMRDAINDRGEDWLGPFIAAMHYRARAQADGIAGLLPLGGVRRALDVGGGSGAFAMAMARRQPGLEAVVFDLPNVVPMTERYVADAGLAGRITTAVGDYLADPLPGGFDFVFVSAVVHSNRPDQNAALVAKCADALNPGGRVAIVDWVMSPDRVAPTAGALFALNMLVATDGGDTFTEEEIAGWLTSAGLADVTRVATPFGTDIVMGDKR
jgi:predicted O-methyltransferase YrrM